MPRSLLLALALVLTTPLVACGPSEGPRSAETERNAAFAFSAALAALEVLDELHYQRMHNNPEPTREQEAWALAHFEKLERLRQTLVIARKWLSGEVAETDGRAAFRDAAELLQLLVDELKALSVPIPKAVEAGLAAAKYIY